jgi:hypothetical protein
MDQSVMVFDDSAARGSAIPSPIEGMVTYLKDTDAVEVYDGSGFALFGGKVLQVVRATDTTDRTLATNVFTDTTLQVTITPLKATSNILLINTYQATLAGSSSNNQFRVRLVTSAGVFIPTTANRHGLDGVSPSSLLYSGTLIGYVAAGSTSAQTFKQQFSRDAGGTLTLANNASNGQLFAIEVGA